MSEARAIAASDRGDGGGAIEAARLSSLRCCLIDGHTVKGLAANADFLRSPPSPRGDFRRAQLYEDVGCRHALGVLARMLAYDCLAYDVNVLRLLPEDATRELSGFGAYMTPARFSLDDYRQIANNIRQPLIALHASRFPELDADDYFDSIEKRFHDWLGSEAGLHDFADSNDRSVHRTFFYLELAQSLGLPAYLSPSKSALLPLATRVLLREALEIVTEVVAKEVQRGSGRVETHDLVELSPLIDYMLRIAESGRISLFDAMVAARRAEAAAAFRDWLWEFQQQLRQSGSASMLTERRYVETIASLARLWGETGDPRLGILYGRQKLSVTVGPSLRWLGSIQIKGERSVTIPLITPADRYLCFISDWYADL